ncbi:MFS transporter [Actinomycetospora lutea]|uniref:MFS transporter n=1 Tax=Actinomycetospora lutea TaxID=663604 RepID=UPI002365F930|nr:MFS transporter [Actinomycetospora lutea]MDD7937964.1 MFS transporter [Actinomycetospora lutea]
MSGAASPSAGPRPSRRSSPAPSSRSARAWALALLALSAAGAGIPSPLYPAYQAQLGFTDVTLAAVYAVYPLVSVPAVFLLGPLGDRLSPRRVMRCGIVIAAAGSLALALATSTGWLILGRVAYGIALAVITGAGVAVATGGADKARAGGVSAIVFILGTGAGPVLGGALAGHGPTPGLLPFGVNLVLLGVVFVGLASVPDGRDGTPVPDGDGDPGTTRTARRALVIAAVNGFLGWAVVGIFLGLISSVADRFLGLGDPLFAGGVAGALLVWSVLTVPVVARLGPRRSQLVGLVALAVSLGVLAIGVGSLVAVLTACVVAGLANGLLYSGATTTVSTMASPGRASRTAAAVYSAFYLGAGLPALLIGVLTTALPLDAALSTIAVGTLALTALMIVVGIVESRRW